MNAKLKKLPAAIREECEEGVRAVFQNPFNPGWQEEMISFSQVPGNQSQHKTAEAVCVRIRRILEAHNPEGAALGSYGEADAECLRILGLYLAYASMKDGLDRIIDRGGEGELRGWWDTFTYTDLDSESAAGFVAVFYQFRRGYRFLDEHLKGDGDSVSAMRQRCWQTLFGANVRWYVRRLWGRLDDCPVLLTGETGVGKSRVARLLGQSGFIPFVADRGLSSGGSGHFSYSFNDAIVPVVIPEYAESLIESALFGHQKGAFTGADRNHQGAFERCRENGIAFLDEIGDISPSVQTKLLRVLQERKFSPVGSSVMHDFAGRVVAATHQDLNRLRQEGTFREDLYYRICSVELRIPSLRERLADEPDELRRLVGEILHAWVGEEDELMVDEMVERIQQGVPPDYPWPGNVRELEQAVRRCCLVGAYDGDPMYEGTIKATKGGFGLSGDPVPARDLLTAYCQWLYAETGKYSEVARITELDRRTVRRHVHPE